jgi:hypothetical protein
MMISSKKRSSSVMGGNTPSNIASLKRRIRYYHIPMQGVKSNLRRPSAKKIGLARTLVEIGLPNSLQQASGSRQAPLMLVLQTSVVEEHCSTSDRIGLSMLAHIVVMVAGSATSPSWGRRDSHSESQGRWHHERAGAPSSSTSVQTARRTSVSIQDGEPSRSPTKRTNSFTSIRTPGHLPRSDSPGPNGLGSHNRSRWVLWESRPFCDIFLIDCCSYTLEAPHSPNTSGTGVFRENPELTLRRPHEIAPVSRSVTRFPI